MAASSKDGHPGSSTTSHFSRRWLAPQSQSWARVAIVLFKPNFQDNSNLTQFQSSRAGILIYRPCYGRVRNAAVLMPDVDEGNRKWIKRMKRTPPSTHVFVFGFFLARISAVKLVPKLPVNRPYDSVTVPSQTQQEEAMAHGDGIRHSAKASQDGGLPDIHPFWWRLQVWQGLSEVSLCLQWMR